MLSLATDRVARIKTSFTTRRVDLAAIAGLAAEGVAIQPGDVVVAKIIELSQHRRIERPDGRRAHLFEGDEVLLAAGARYAPDQFEADCPTEIGPAHLAAAGGVAGLVRASHDRMRAPTNLEILGVAVRKDGRRIHLRDFALPATITPPQGLPVIAVCGASMNAGKTHTAAMLVRGLTSAGLRVAALKVTGTGSGGDLWFYEDAGAIHVGDFTDVGFATTYRAALGEVIDGADRLIADAAIRGADIIVMELADGLHQLETAALLSDPGFQQRLTGTLFAANDALSAQSGVAWLKERGLEPLAVAGGIGRSPLAMREASNALNVQCLFAHELATAEIVDRLPIDGAKTFAAKVAA